MRNAGVKPYVLAWIALLVLLSLSAGSSLLALGTFNLVSNFAIAALKAALVVIVFMRIRRSERTVHVAAAAGIALPMSRPLLHFARRQDVLIWPLHRA